MPRTTWSLFLFAGAIAACIWCAARASAAAISFTGTDYSQNFDGLPAAGSFTFSGLGPFNLSDPPVNAAGLDGWQFGKGAGAGSNALFRVDAGASTTGAAYSYGNGVASSERGLGMLASSTTSPVIGAIFTNDSGGALTQFTLAFTVEQWRNGDGLFANTQAFSYSVGGTDILNGTFVSSTNLDFSSMHYTEAAGPLDGNDAANRKSVTATISGIQWNAGQRLVIRWSDFNDPDGDDALAIDDFSFSAAGGAKNLTFNPGGRDWNTAEANLNWLDGATAASFHNGDIVNLTTAGAGAVVVDAAGVAPGATNISNTAGTYTISGGPIGGSGALTKTGAGELILASLNTYSGGTLIYGGTLAVADDNRLGAPTGGLGFDNSTLKLLGPINSARNITINPGGATIDTGGFDAILTGSLAGSGPFAKIGAGNLAIGGNVNTTGTVSVAEGMLTFNQLGAGTQSIVAPPTPGGFAGDFIIATDIRLNVLGGSISGGGKIQFQTTLASLCVTGTTPANTATVDNDIQLNPLGKTGPFRTHIGSTGADAGPNTLIINAPISGAADVAISAGDSGGAGIVVLNVPATYTGTTYFLNANTGVLRLGVDDALPITTTLSEGDGVLSTNAGALDLNGHRQSLAAIKTDLLVGRTANGIVNTGDDTATLTITGNQTTTFAASIGTPGVDVNLPNANDHIHLVLGPAHTGSLTLTELVTHDRGTSVYGGTLTINGEQSYLEPSTLDVHGGIVNLNTDGTSMQTVEVTGGSLRYGASQHPRSIALSSTGDLIVRQGNDKLVRTPSLTIEGSGGIDLEDNRLIVDAPFDQRLTVLAEITADIASGAAALSWTGPGIRSSLAATDPSNLTAVGVLLNDDGLGGTLYQDFGGESVDSSSILVRFTYYGDADLSGVVDGTDYALIDNGFNAGLKGWFNGDFDYNGTIDGTDYALIDNAFNAQHGPLGIGLVPEPSGGVLAAIGAGIAGATVRGRRRR